jgi:hypothetical protein
MWNSKQHFTRDSYREHVQKIAYETMNGFRTPTINGKSYLPHWWTQNEVRVFWDSTIPQKTVNLIVDAVDERIQETIGLQFRFVMLGNHVSATKQVTDATINGQIDRQRLFASALSESWRDPQHGGRQHADIYITTKSFIDDTVSWGACSFKYGTMIFALYGQRHQNHNFLRRVALHETSHLLGMYCHCDDYQNVDEYRYIPDCNMHYNCSSTDLCPKCTEFIQHWWNQILYEYEQS